MLAEPLEHDSPVDQEDIVHYVCQCQLDLEEIHSMCGKTANKVEQVFIYKNVCIVCEDLNNYSCQFCGN